MNMLTTLGCVVAAVVLFLITIASAAIKIVQEYELRRHLPPGSADRR